MDMRPFEQLFFADLNRLSHRVNRRPPRVNELLELCHALIDQYEKHLLVDSENQEAIQNLIYGKLAFAYECIGKDHEAAYLYEASSSCAKTLGGSAGFWSLIGIDQK